MNDQTWEFKYTIPGYARGRRAWVRGNDFTHGDIIRLVKQRYFQSFGEQAPFLGSITFRKISDAGLPERPRRLLEDAPEGSPVWEIPRTTVWLSGEMICYED